MSKMSKRFSTWHESLKTTQMKRLKPKSKKVEIVTSLMTTVMSCSCLLGYSTSLLFDGIIARVDWVVGLSGLVVGFMFYRLQWLSRESAKLDAHYWIVNAVATKIPNQDLFGHLKVLIDTGDRDELMRLRWACGQLGYEGLVTLLDRKLT